MDERSPLRRSNPDRPLELVLGMRKITLGSSMSLIDAKGIKSTGASCLLLTEAQTRSWASANRRPLPKPSRKTYPDSYSSLSPISFTSIEQLKAKLSSLKVKASKKGRGNWEYDTSQANKGYPEGHDGSHRARFEHSR
jgi:hypothetical protein